MAVVFGENGGFVAQNSFLFVPAEDTNTGLVYVGIIDASSFDDAVDGSFYAYRAEDISTMRMPTVRRVGLIYRDLGPATLFVSVRGTDDNGSVIEKSVSVKLGNTVPTFATLNAFADIVQPCYRPQVILRRFPGGGPIQIISTTLWGDVDDTAP